MSVSIGGAKGSYSDEAARAIFGESVEPFYCTDFRAALEALTGGVVESCVLPLENSTVGPVPEVHSLLLEERMPPIVGEHLLPVHHQLLALPGTTLETLRRVTSHPMGLAQCAGFLRRHSLAAVPGADTAGCAEALSRTGGPAGTGVIASRRCAALYNLSIVAEDIADLGGNTTRFVLFGRAPPDPKGSWKLSLAVAPLGGPSGLGALLERWRGLGLELTRLVSRPGSVAWETVYFVDLVHESRSFLASAELELDSRVKSHRALGLYPFS